VASLIKLAYERSIVAVDGRTGEGDAEGRMSKAEQGERREKGDDDGEDEDEEQEEG
jgi:hypothetical protein